MQIKALSNGIGIGETRQRKIEVTEESANSVIEAPPLHRTAYVVERRDRLQRRKSRSFLFQINYMLLAAVVDFTALVGFFIVSSFFGFALYCVAESAASFSPLQLVYDYRRLLSFAAETLRNASLQQFSLVFSSVMLIYYLLAVLVLGRSYGANFAYRFMKSKQERFKSH